MNIFYKTPCLTRKYALLSATSQIKLLFVLIHPHSIASGCIKNESKYL